MVCIYFVECKKCVSKNGKGETQIKLWIFYETQNMLLDTF